MPLLLELALADQELLLQELDRLVDATLEDLAHPEEDGLVLVDHAG